MNAHYVDEAVQSVECLNAVLASETGRRQSQYATAVRPLSIVRRWCVACQSSHWYQIQNANARQRFAQRFAQKGKEVAFQILLGELIVMSILGLAASALAAIR